MKIAFYDNIYRKKWGFLIKINQNDKKMLNYCYAYPIRKCKNSLAFS